MQYFTIISSYLRLAFVCNFARIEFTGNQRAELYLNGSLSDLTHAGIMDSQTIVDGLDIYLYSPKNSITN